MRLWLLLRRRRRLLTLLTASSLACVLLSFLGIPGVMSPAGRLEAFDTSDYDLNYDSEASVHAMVRQMSSVKRRKALLEDAAQDPGPDALALPDSDPDHRAHDTSLRFQHPAPLPASSSHRKRKVRLGIGDYPDIPDDVPKKYSFIHQQVKSTAPGHNQLQAAGEPTEPDLQQPRPESQLKTDHKLPEKDDDYAEQEEEEEDDDYPEDGEETLIDARDEDEQDEELYDEEYDYANPNPVFRDGDFDPALANADANANNASRPEPLRFQAAEQGQRAVEDGYDDANGAYYADNGADADEYAEEHDTHVNGRMLRSEPVAPSDQDVNRVKHATRFHTPLKLQNSHINAQDAQRRLRTPVANSHQRSRHKSNKILFQNHVPNVVVDNSIARDSVIQTGRQQASDQDFRAPAHVSREGRAGSRAARPPLPAAAAAVPEAPATQIQTPRQPRRLGPVVYSNAGFPIVEDSVFWSQRVESFVPPGVSEHEVALFSRRARALPAVELHPARWNRCGRDKNQYVVLSDGTALCARYRDPHNKLIHGEALSFYLSRLLGLDAVPAVTLVHVNASAGQWLGVNVTGAGWQDGRTVALIQWIHGLDSERSRVKLPAVMLSAYDTGVALDRHAPALLGMTPAELSELLQWSDLVLLDYITGHYDRFASMQDGADREHRPSILAESVRNLRQVPETGKLWLIDNESGLLDAYELLYQGRDMGRRFQDFHRRMLRTFCIFRQGTVQRLRHLASQSSPHETLLHFAQKAEPLLQEMPRTAEYKLFKGYFHTRLKEVLAWVDACRKER